MQSIAKQTGKKIDELEMPELDYVGVGFYNLFVQIKAFRQLNVNAQPMPVTNVELLAWCELTNTKLTPFELNVVQTLDRVSLNTWYKQQRSNHD